MNHEVGTHEGMTMLQLDLGLPASQAVRDKFLLPIS